MRSLLVIVGFLSLPTLLLVACYHSNEKEKAVHLEPEVFVSEIDSSHTEDVHEVPLDSLRLDTGPPFKYPCPCVYGKTLEIRHPDGSLDELQPAVGWDTRYPSCTYFYGENIYNAHIMDSSISVARIHMVDLPSDEILLTPEFLRSTKFKQHVIVTTWLDPIERSMETIFDPNRTGKYPKPEHWR